MERPIRGRNRDAYDKTSLRAGSLLFNASSTDLSAPKQYDVGRKKAPSVWKSAILFPDVPCVQNNNWAQSTIQKEMPSNESQGCDTSTIPLDSKDEDVYHSAKFLYEEMSTLFEKWSDEDGKEMKITGNKNNHNQAIPDVGTSLESKSQAIHTNRNELYCRAPPGLPESSCDSMTLAYNKMSLTLVKNQMLFHSKYSRTGDSLTSSITPMQTKKSNQQITTPLKRLWTDSPVGNVIRFCTLCKKNGETREFYTSHVVKDSNGNVVCPILREFVCPVCGATGSISHTLSYCPVAKIKKN